MAVKKTVKKELIEEVQEKVMVDEKELSADEVTVETPVVEEKDEEKTPEVEVSDPEIKSAPPVSKNVTVKVHSTVSFYYGGEYYHFVAGSTHRVPPAVRCHMNKMGMLTAV